MALIQPPPNYPHPSFWRALLVVRNAIIEEYMDRQLMIPFDQRPSHFVCLSIVDTWLDVAMEEGWVDADLS